MTSIALPRTQFPLYEHRVRSKLEDLISRVFSAPFAKTFSAPLGGAAAVWTPKDITGCSLWLDFSDITTLYQDSGKTAPITADAQTIGAAVDKSLSGNDGLQVTSTSYEPAYKTNIKNGLSVSRYVNGTGTKLVSTFNSNQPVTIYLVAACTAGLDDQHPLDGINGRHLIGISGSKFVLYSGAVLYDGVRNTNWHIFKAIFNGASSAIAIDAGADASGNAGTENVTKYTIGGGVNTIDTAGGFTGDIGEVLIYNSSLASGNQALVLAYLNTKWAIY